MAFWGIEVKPGKPVTHSFDKVRRRLRISQATLGIGSAVKKALVQCNVGNKSPVFLCALLPDKTESCHLDLEFEEADDVVFSVIGPRSVYLTGYYVTDSRHSVPGSDTETYGEDIANTETEESGYNTDEDKYEDSFIDDDDDDDPEVYPSSPVSSDQDDKKMPGKDKMREPKGTRKLRRKRMQVIDSDHDSTSEESEDEDNFILSVFKSKKAPKADVSEVEEKDGQGSVNAADNKADGGTSETLEDNFVNHGDGLLDAISQGKNRRADNNGNLVASNEDKSESGPVSKRKSKRKRKEQSHEVKSLGDDSGKEDKAPLIEAEADSSPHDLLQLDKDACEPTVTGNLINSVLLLPPAEVSSGSDQNPKKRKKGGRGEKSVKSNNDTSSNIPIQDDFKQQVLEASHMIEDLVATTDEYKKPTTHRASDPGAEGHKLEKGKKKKKKSKAVEVDANLKNNVSILSENENRKSPMKLEESNSENRTSQARTLSNGLTIEELASGEKDGKVATLGRKVKIFYTAKLKDSGHVFDSNFGKSPFKFRLGDKTVIEGWNVGLEGMRIGGQRRLTIPPSMGFGRQGAGENIPPNSWLVYEVELAGAR